MDVLEGIWGNGMVFLIFVLPLLIVLVSGINLGYF